MSLNRKVKDMDTKESRRKELMGMCLEGGYLNEEILDQINELDRFAPILIRCGGGQADLLRARREALYSDHL